MMPCSRLGEKWRPEARALLEHVLSCKFSRLGSVARQGMEALSPSRLRMLDTIDFLKGLSGSARKKNAEALLRKAVEELRNSAHVPNRIFKTIHIEFHIHICSWLNFNGPVKHLYHFEPSQWSSNSASNRSSTSGTQCVMTTLNANTTRVDLQEDIQRAALSVTLRLNHDLFTLFLFGFVVRHLLLN